MTAFWVAIILVDGIAFGIISSLAVKRKHRDPFGWFLIGFIFGVFGFLAALLVEDIEEDTPYQAKVKDTKKCPDCAEEIKFDAKVCRFCGKRFDGLASSNQSNTALQDTTAPHKLEGAISDEEKITKKKAQQSRDVRCPSCYSMNYPSDDYCCACGKELYSR